MLLNNINWSDPRSQITPHFTVHEATYLSTWGIYHTPSDEEREQLVKLCVIMETVRELLGVPINVHCMIRPNKVNCPNSPHHGEDYNAAIGSTARRSAHIMGQAIDFSTGHSSGSECDAVRGLLLPQLEFLGLRMENNPYSPWVHLDTYPTTWSAGMRYFKV